MYRVSPFCLFLFLPALAFADDVILNEIRVTDSTAHESAKNVSAFTTVIAPQQHAAEMRSTAELLNESVGVNTTDFGGLGQLSTVSIRGSSAEQVAVFVDGVRINTAQSGAVDFASIPLDAIERIEVIRGGGSTQFGTDAIGGVINIVTKKTTGKRSGEVRMTSGSFTTFKSALSWHEPFEHAGVTLAHTHLSSNGDYPFTSAATNLAGTHIGGGDTFTRLHNRSIAEDVLAKSTIDLSETWHLTVSNDFSWSDRRIPGTEEETTLLFPAKPLKAVETTYRNTTALAINDDHCLIDSLSWELGATNLFTNDHFEDQNPALGNPVNVLFLNDSVSGYTLWKHIIEGAATNLTSSLRYQYRYDDSTNSSPLAGAALLGHHLRHTHALLAESELDLFRRTITFVPSFRMENTSDRQFHAIWKGGTVLRPVSFVDVKANIQTSHRYPSFDELYFPDQGYLRGNPNLDDEHSFGGDVGFIVHPEHFSVEATYFRQRIDNLILFVPVSAVTLQPVNTARVNTDGLEFAVLWKPIPLLGLNANYTWLRAHFASNGLSLPGRPEHKLNNRIDTTYRNLNAFAELQYVSSFPINIANTVKLSPRMTENIGTTVQFAKRLFATFEIKDIGNVQLYDARGFPLPRRSYWLTVGAKV